MISVQKESRQVAQSVVHEVIDAFDEFMLNETDDRLGDTTDLFHRSAAEKCRQNPIDVSNSTVKAFEKFDASFRIDEIAQFQETFHFNAVGLDSSYCTSNTSSIESNNMSFAQESLLSFSRSAHHKPALLDTSQSHNDEDDISFSSSSSFVLEAKRGDDKTGVSKLELKYDVQESKRTIEQRSATSRTSRRRKTRNGTNSGDNDGLEVMYTVIKGSRNPNDDSFGQSNTHRVHAQNMGFTVNNTTSSYHSKKQNDSMGQSSTKQINSRDAESSLSDNLIASSHHSQSSLHRKPYESPRRRVTSTTKRLDKATGNASNTELNSSSHHSQTLRRNPFRSPRRRAMSRDLSKTESMHSSASDVSASSLVRHYNKPLEKISSNDIHGTDPNTNNSPSNDDSLDAVDGVSDRQRGKTILICSDGLVSSSSHHSQSSRRKGLSSPRHRGRGSSRSNLGICEKHEPSEGTEGLTSTASPTKISLRRARSRSRPRLKALGGEMKTSAISADSQSHRRCHSQPRLSREIVTDATCVQQNQSWKDEDIESNETQTTRIGDHAALDARTAARIERARASREKHLAKLQKEKEKTRNENRNHELFEGLAHQNTSSYHQ